MELKSFLEESPFPVMRVTSEGRLVYANEASRPILDQWECALHEVIPAGWRNSLLYSTDKTIKTMNAQCDGSMYEFAVVPVPDKKYYNIYASNITNEKLYQGALKQRAARHRNKAERQEELVVETRESLASEVVSRKQTERRLAHREHVLYAIHDISTSIGSSLHTIFDRITASIAENMQTTSVVIYETASDSHPTISQRQNSRAGPHLDVIPLACRLFSSQKPQQVTVSSASHEQLRECLRKHNARSLLNIPILDQNNARIGGICLLDRKERSFSSHEIQIVEIFAHYAGSEIIRKKLEKQLLQAQEMRLLGLMTCGVAHEVRNPLNAISAVMDALFLEMKGNKDYEIYLTHMRKHINRLASLMEDLLQLGRPLSKTKMQPVILKAIIVDAIVAWRKTTHTSRLVNLNAKGSAERLTIKADGVKLQDVFVNVLENAALHSGNKKPVTIYIKHAASRKNVYVYFVDAGRGIPEENLERIFEPFYTTRRSGTGLGMSIVRHITQSHDGAVRVYNNEPLPGLTVEFRFPVASLID
ncbi:MAG: GAF domain-containing protein [Chitinivibrionales bacterium]|nr:GAF domain-containing protein [Chitinivibrionales bacterium]